MNRVFATGGAGTIGQAVVRRLFRDPDFEFEVLDQPVASDWLREGCDVHTGELRQLGEARKATSMSVRRWPSVEKAKRLHREKGIAA